jgi:SAM-dependent methyltransferase
MRITYRTRGVHEYWTRRWAEIPVDKPMENRHAYPLKYAELTVTRKDGPILEAGCGVGRILRHYHERGYEIVGIDYIETAIRKLKQADPTLRAEVGDITKLRFADQTFRYVLAFGLYHNLENGLQKAISETHRVLMNSGVVCASFRADNIQTRLSDWLAERYVKRQVIHTPVRAFHKINLTYNEYVSLFTSAGFEVLAVYHVENMPLLYKFAFFRSATHKRFDENKARREGYQLSMFGRILQHGLMRFFPNQFCNVYVLIARKGGS